MARSQPVTQKANFDIFVKHSIGKPILLIFENLSSIFCPKLRDVYIEVATKEVL